jgi:hypothetical protein
MSGCLLKFPGQADVSPVLYFSRYEHLDVDEQILLRADRAHGDHDRSTAQLEAAC